MLRLPVLCATAVLLAGCSGSAGQPSAGAAPTPSAAASSLFDAAPSECEPGSAELTWPDSVPADLPKPQGARLTDVADRPDGLTVVRFTTESSLRDGVQFLLQEMPAAGYTLARGDAENTEADVPFVKGRLRGVLRMIAVEPCRTDWLMALARSGPSAPPGTAPPLLPPRPDASPLPFG